MQLLIRVVAAVVLSMGFLACEDDAAAPDDNGAAAVEGADSANEPATVSEDELAQLKAKASEEANSITADNAESELEALEKELADDE